MRGCLVVLACLIMSCCSPSAQDPSAQGANSSNIVDGAPSANSEIPSRPAAANSSEPTPTAALPKGNACMVQDNEALSVPAIRATGTEPFWSAQVEGRCVTYSTPDNQGGTRVWTRFSHGSGDSRTWFGNLNGKTFEMRVRSEAGCSDGMSDNRYPLAVEVTVEGEMRKGCAKPL